MEVTTGGDRPGCQTSDAELITQGRSGSRTGFEQLVDRHLPRLLAFLRYLRAPPDQIEDLAQEAFEKAFARLDLWKPDRDFLTWLLSIARNLVIDFWRRTGRAPVISGLVTEPVSSCQVEEQAINRATLDEALNSLPEASRLLLDLRVVRRTPFRELAELVGENENVLRVRVHRMLMQLRTLLQDQKHG